MSTGQKKQRPALGMGLDALLPDRLEGEYFLCAIEDIRPSAQQPRHEFSDDTIQELAQSIREKGLIQPVILRRSEDGSYELIAGERRWRAAQRAGLREIPAILRDAEDREVLEMALVENLQREDLNPVDEAQAYRLLLDQSGLTQEELANRIGKSRAAVANGLRLLSLPPSALEALRASAITPGHARAILSVGDPDGREELLSLILKRALSVRQAEVQAKRLTSRRPTKPLPKDPNLKALEQRLARSLGTRVTVHQGKRKGSGRITIDYRNLDDLDRILSVVESAPEA